MSGRWNVSEAERKDFKKVNMNMQLTKPFSDVPEDP